MKYKDICLSELLIAELSKIEQLRTSLLKSSDMIVVDDFGAGSRVFSNDIRPVNKIARVVLQSEKVALSIMSILIFWRSKGQGGRILEMGTSLGVTTAYLAASGWDVETWEGCKNTAEYARCNWQGLGYDGKIKSKIGTFNALLNEDKGGWDVVFLDGHHDGPSTIKYVEILKTKLNPGGAILIDDIDWSESMKIAWERLLEDPHWNITMKWRGKGWLFNRVGDVEQHLKLRKSYIPLSKFI